MIWPRRGNLRLDPEIVVDPAGHPAVCERADGREAVIMACLEEQLGNQFDMQFGDFCHSMTFSGSSQLRIFFFFSPRPVVLSRPASLENISGTRQYLT